ncbi:unnamed protein product (macronuclear) [Paramecium tetraurelia]|uniref:C2H2-type domain-containing protein n=1 Tax=Paramecium tetraurelia TaxID=5888 RepID=A0EC78_PARTE|nr:uncharacterized protein GSPATT00025631001 [Paramecium tetraurelia]CAK92895.1 unnamed protein product [Paramecium tetraurelia]|eukprot:XP_001460292.1 hypothetical protein (macronuclear) [Paramecium tetraurelia strain d4-2]
MSYDDFYDNPTFNNCQFRCEQLFSDAEIQQSQIQSISQEKAKDLQVFDNQQSQAVVEEVNLKYKCDYCSCEFEIPQAKGGHTAKCHSKKSESYQKKQDTKVARQPIVMSNRRLQAIAYQALFE